MDWPNNSNPLTSSMAFSADWTLSKTMKACPLRFKLDLATMSTMVPYSSKISRSASMSCGILMRSDKFLALESLQLVVLVHGPGSSKVQF
jgi:hypothetical protein